MPPPYERTPSNYNFARLLNKTDKHILIYGGNMYGLSFEIPIPRGFPLRKILQYSIVKKYNWYVVDSQNDTWDYHMEHLLFERTIYEGSAFYEKIQQEHFVIFLKLQAYFYNDPIDEILSYDDFCKSKCQLLLLINDCTHAELYIKDKTVLADTYQHLLSNGFCNVCYIDESNDRRVKMSVT